MLFKSKSGLKLSKHLSILFSLLLPISATAIPSIHNCSLSSRVVLAIPLSWDYHDSCPGFLSSDQPSLQ